MCKDNWKWSSCLKQKKKQHCVRGTLAGNNCARTCGFCEAAAAAAAAAASSSTEDDDVDLDVSSSLTSAPSEQVDASNALIGGGVASVALLFLLLFASRPSTRAYFRAAAAAGQTSGPALAPSTKVTIVMGPMKGPSSGPIFSNQFVLQSTTAADAPAVDDRAVPASAVSASSTGASSDAASSKALSAQPDALAGKSLDLDCTTVPVRLSAVAAAQKWLSNEMVGDRGEPRYT